MGGRGASSYRVIKRLKNYQRATIPRHKMTDYLLNPNGDKNKADFFKTLGYNMKNRERLKKDILEKLKMNKALSYGKNINGDEVFQVNMLLGISKKCMVATGWVIPKGSKAPRLVTAYHNKKLKGRSKQ